IGRSKSLRKRLVQLPIGGEVAAIDQALAVQILGEDLCVLVESSILNHGPVAALQLAVQSKLLSEEEDLGTKCPRLHVPIEIGKVGILIVRFKEGGQPILLAKERCELGLTSANITSDGDELFRSQAAFKVLLAFVDSHLRHCRRATRRFGCTPTSHLTL